MDFIKNAREFYMRHTNHIDNLIIEKQNEYSPNNFGYKPSEEDINHPELWKDNHWIWFDKNHGLN